MNKYTQIDITTTATQLEKDRARLADPTTPERVRARAARGVNGASRKIELLTNINWDRLGVSDDANQQLAQSRIISQHVNSVLSDDDSGYNQPMTSVEFKKLYW